MPRYHPMSSSSSGIPWSSKLLLATFCTVLIFLVVRTLFFHHHNSMLAENNNHYKDDENIDHKSDQLAQQLKIKLQNNNDGGGYHDGSSSSSGRLIKKEFQSLFCSSSNTNAENQSEEESYSSSSLKIACVGDSITFGNGSHDKHFPKSKKNYAGNYPLTLKQQLLLHVKKKKNTKNLGNVLLQVRNFGINGATVGTGKKKFSYRSHKEFRQALEFNADIILIMLGTNDCKTTVWKDRETLEQDYTTFLQSFLISAAEKNQKRKKNKKKSNNQLKTNQPWIIVVTPPPVASTSDSISWNFDPKRLHEDVVPSIRNVVKDFNIKHRGNGDDDQDLVSLIDFHKIFYEEEEGHRHWTCPPSSSSSSHSQEHDPSFKCLFKDGVHPVKGVHDFMAEFIGEKMCQV